MLRASYSTSSASEKGASAINLSGCSESAAMRRRPSASARRAVSRGSIAASFRNLRGGPAKEESSSPPRAHGRGRGRRTMAHAPVLHGDGHDGSRSPRGGPSADALLVIPCCGIANRVRVFGAVPSERTQTAESPWAGARRGRSIQLRSVVAALVLQCRGRGTRLWRCQCPRPRASHRGCTCAELGHPAPGRHHLRRVRGPYRPGDVLQGPCVIRGCIMPPTLGPQHAESLFNRAGLATIATIRNATQAIHEARRKRPGATPLRLEQLGSRAITRMCSTQARRCRPYGRRAVPSVGARRAQSALHARRFHCGARPRRSPHCEPQRAWRASPRPG